MSSRTHLGAWITELLRFGRSDRPLHHLPQQYLVGAFGLWTSRTSSWCLSLRVVIGEPARQPHKTAVSQSTTTECQTEERPTTYSRSRTPAASSMSSTQGLQMHQSSTQLHRQKTSPLLQHSASYPSLGYAHPGVVAQHSTGRRGRSSSRAEWTVQVRRQYIESSICEDPEEGPVAYWTTWYLHHQRYLRNMESRTLRLDRFASHWHRDLQDPGLASLTHWTTFKSLS